MPTIIRRRTILFPRVIDSTTRKGVSTQRPKNVSEKALRSQLHSIGGMARRSSRAALKATTSK